MGIVAIGAALNGKMWVLLRGMTYGAQRNTRLSMLLMAVSAGDFGFVEAALFIYQLSRFLVAGFTCHIRIADI